MRHIKFYWPLLIGAPLLLAFLVIATLLTSARYEQNQQVWLDQLNQTPGLGATWFTYEGGLFTQRSELHLNLVDPALFLNSLGLSTQAELGSQLAQIGPLEIYLQVDTLLLPGYASSQAHLIENRGSLATKQESGELQVGDLELQWQLASWRSELNLHLTSGRWALQSTQGRIVLDPATMTLKGNPDSNLAIQWQLGGITLSNEERSLGLRGLTGQVDLQPTHDYWLMPKLQLQLDEGSYQSESASPVELSGAMISGAVIENKNGLLTQVDMQWQGRLAYLGFNLPAQRHELEDLSLGVKLGGIDQQGYKALVWSAATDFNDTQGWQDALNRITRSGFHLQMTPSQLQLHQGVLRAEGEITSRPFDMAQLNGLASLRSLLQGNVAIHADPQVAEQLSPSSEELTVLQQAGYIELAKNGKLHSQLRMVNGKLSANGYKLPW